MSDDNQVEALARQSELNQEKLRLLIRLHEIEVELDGLTVTTNVPKRRRDKPIVLEALLEVIAQQSKQPLTISDFLILSLKAGYTSDAHGFGNLVYQALRKLTRTGKLRKNREQRVYEWVGIKSREMPPDSVHLNY